MHDVCYQTESVFIYTGNNRDIHYTKVLAKHMWNSGGRTKSNQLRKQNNSMLISCSCMRRNYRSCSSIVLACAGITKRIR